MNINNRDKEKEMNNMIVNQNLNNRLPPINILNNNSSNVNGGFQNTQNIQNAAQNNSDEVYNRKQSYNQANFRSNLNSREKYNSNTSNQNKYQGIQTPQPQNYTPQSISTPSSNNNNDVFIMQELNNTKRILKNIFENQNELQTKVIEYNKIITEQENIIRLNNIKLNEHDSKLTEILITFNNYLQLNDKTTKIVNDLTLKCEDSLKKSEFSELKANVYNFNRINENKIFENVNKVEELNMKTTELTKEQEVFHKYTLEKLKAYQNEAMETRIQQQQQLIKFEESRENKINQQFDQMKGLIKILEKNLTNEGVYRKNMIENSQEEIKQVLIKKDERILTLEKNQLETEKKLINFNKDYITTFQELIMKHNQKYDIELKSIRSLLGNEVFKIESKIEEETQNIKNELFDLKANNSECRNSLTQFEFFFKENFEGIENKYENFSKELQSLKTNFESISDTLSKFMKENLVTIENKIDLGTTSLENKLNKKINELSSNLQILENKTDKKLTDSNEKIESTNKTIAELILLKNELFKTTSVGSHTTGVDSVLYERKIEDKIEAIKQELEEYEKKLIMLMNLHIDTMKKNINDEQKKLVNDISDKLEVKVTVLKKDFESSKREEELIREGRIQEYIIESENRLKKGLENRINKLQQQVENISIKFVQDNNEKDDFQNNF